MKAFKHKSHTHSAHRFSASLSPITNIPCQVQKVQTERQAQQLAIEQLFWSKAMETHDFSIYWDSSGIVCFSHFLDFSARAAKRLLQGLSNLLGEPRHTTTSGLKLDWIATRAVEGGIQGVRTAQWISVDAQTMQKMHQAQEQGPANSENPTGLNLLKDQ